MSLKGGTHDQLLMLLLVTADSGLQMHMHGPFVCIDRFMKPWQLRIVD